MKLTKTTVERLDPPATGYAMYWDAALPGFGVRVTASGVKSFVLQRRIKGKEHRITMGRYGVLTVEQARREATKLLGQIASGQDPLADKARAKLEAVTLREAMEAYLSGRNLKPGTVTDVREVMRKLGDWMDKPITGITRDMVSARHRKLGEASNARANLAMRYLRAILNFAAAEYTDADGKPLLADNPVKRLSQTKAWYRVDRRRTVIKPHQLRAWLQAVLALDNETARDYLVFVILTGLRRGEALTLCWENVDLAGRTVTVADTKNHKPHTLPLSDYLLDMMFRRKAVAIGEYVFETGKGLSRFRHQMKLVTEQSGVDFCVHDLRRTFATIADSLDIPGYAVKALLNHANGADVTAGYIVMDVERLRRPMQRITDYVLIAGGVREGADIIPLMVGAHEA